MENTGFTLEGRVLCSDDACVGLVGPDGNCKVCDKTYAGSESLPEERSGSESDLRPETSTPDASHEPDVAPVAPAEFKPGDRTCCPDDACVGVIAADGNCGTCGRSAT